MSEITFKEVEITKLNLQPGEMLIVKIKSDDIDQSVIEHFRKAFLPHFPNNKVLIMGTAPEDDVEFSVIKDESQSCGPSFCEDCSCGKKEQSEA